MKILIVEDDKKIAKNIAYYLSRFHFLVEIANTYKEAKEKIENTDFSLYIIDRMLPDGTGDQFIMDIRTKGIKSPIILLTAMTQLEDKVNGLNLGADDYITKPFHLPELHARVKALLRRPVDALVNPVINIDDLVIDTNNRQVTRNGQEIPLSPKLYALLECLAFNLNVVVSREDILEKVWDQMESVDTNTVDVHIRYLRKLIDDDFEKKLIKTVKGKGYYICG